MISTAFVLIGFLPFRLPLAVLLTSPAAPGAGIGTFFRASITRMVVAYAGLVREQGVRTAPSPLARQLWRYLRGRHGIVSKWARTSRFSHQVALKLLDEQKAKVYYRDMDEGRKRVIGIIAGLLVARHLKTTMICLIPRTVRGLTRWLRRPCSGLS